MSRNRKFSAVALALFGAAAVALAQAPSLTEPASDAPKADAGASGDAKEKAGDDKDAAKSTTEIYADEAKFNQKAHIGVFSKNVRVENPNFVLTCNRLTAHLRHDDAKPAGKPGDPSGGKLAPTAGVKVTADGAPVAPKNLKGAATPKPAKGKTPPATPPPATPAPATPAPAGGKPALPGADQKGGGLEKADAEGDVVIHQDKTDEKGNVTHGIAHAQRALYDGITGDVTLMGKPDVQQGQNHCIALDENAVIVLNRDGNMTVHGKHKTVLESMSAPGAAAPGAPAAHSTPAPGA